MSKTICDWSKKELEAKSEKLYALTKDACYFCRKCGRVANTKKVLCKAENFGGKLKSPRVYQGELAGSI